MNKKLNKAQWIERILWIVQNAPAGLAEVPDDLSVAQLLLEVIVAEQQKLGTDNLATLAGLAASFFSRFQGSRAAPSFVNNKGEAVYTEGDVARQLGIPVEKVRALADELIAAGAEDIYSEADPDELQALH
ncbi:MAG: hypothetical protein LBI31_01580 [Zoogloeaceae bacterium]|jgi:hypothetical protein|nr:hypothetical protein [Zoogloeaceae bacterium]